MKIVLFILFLAVSIAAQENRPRLIDEIGKLPSEELQARIGAWGIEAGKSADSRVLVRISGGAKSEFASAYVFGSVIKSIWNNSLKYRPETLLIQVCGIDNEPVQAQVFAVGEKDKAESCEDSPNAPTATVLFETADFKTILAGSSEVEFNAIESNFTVPEGSDGEYSEFAQNVLKKFLNDSPASRLYIISYLNTNFETDESGKVISGKPNKPDKKSISRKMIRSAKNELLKKGFSAAQIVTLDGGYVNGNGRRLEFWFVPEGGAIPRPKPEYLPKSGK